MDVLLQQHQLRGSDRSKVTHTVTRVAGDAPVKLSVPAEDLSDFYAAIVLPQASCAAKNKYFQNSGNNWSRTIMRSLKTIVQ